MFVRKLFEKENPDDFKVFVNMENDSSMIIPGNEAGIISHQHEQPITNKLSSKSSGTNSVIPQHVPRATDDVNNENNSLRKKDHRLVETSAVEQNSPVVTLITDVEAHLDPILDYASEPLLPLVEACAPLTKIVHDLSVYVRLALDETPHEPADGLTFDESAAIRLYTIEWEESHASLYSMINRTLKKSSRQALRPYYKYLKLFLTALVKLPCAPLQTVWRGVNKDFSKTFPRGTPVIWWAFSSCTTSLTVLENNMYLSDAGERTLFSVEAMNGRIVRDHSHFDFEDEILLLPGTYMEVQSHLSPASGLHIIHLKQTKPLETLLELPFEGALLYPVEKKKVPWYKKKRTVVELSLLVILCLAGIIVGSVLGTRRSPPPPLCYTRKPAIPADLFWSFDCGDAREDIKEVDNGTNENGANYSSPDFSGQGKALNLNQRQNQYVLLPYSLNLTKNTSFTISAWVFFTDYNQATILSECNPVNSLCIKFYVWGVHVYVETYNWNDGKIFQLINGDGWSTNYQSCWIYVTFVFNNQNDILSIYLNGDPTISSFFSPSSFPMITTNQSKTSYTGIGSDPSNLTSFDGLIDQLSIAYYVKNDSEILDEATLLCDYNFDNDDINADSGPNNITAYSENVSRSLSNNESNLLFNSNDSFFQSTGFTLLMSNLYAFTIAFWIRPIIMTHNTSNIAIAVLQLASQVQQVSSESYACFLTLCINNINSNEPSLQLEFEQLNMVDSVNTIMKNNTWTHIGVSYSNGTQITVYIGGQRRTYINDFRFPLLLYNPRLAVTMGGAYFDDSTTIKPTNYASRKCFAEYPQHNFIQMNGEIDDLKVFARALTPVEFAILGNSNNTPT